MKIVVGYKQVCNSHKLDEINYEWVIKETVILQKLSYM
jgi:hypothetical protein